MQRKQRQEPNEEPAVTFELEEAQQPQRRGPLGAAGTAAVTGAGLVAGGATPSTADSLDVFEQPADYDQSEDPVGAIPTTSFSDIAEPEGDPEFPDIDFSTPDTTEDTDPPGDALHGATGAVGGGFRLDDPAGQEALAAPDIDLEPVGDSLVDQQVTDDDTLADDGELDDIDLP